MNELSLHILDIINNSVKAGAALIILEINEDIAANRLIIVIADDGCGMDAEFLREVLDPFKTTRTTRKVGMGLSLFKSAAEQTGGGLTISSQPGVGTTVTAEFTYDSIDRQPIGDIAATITTVLSGNDGLDIMYTHTICGESFVTDTREIREILGDVSLSSPEVIMWIKDYIDENTEEIRARHCNRE